MPAPIANLTTTAREAGYTKGGYVPTGTIAHLVGYRHVSESYLSIGRDYWAKAKRAGYARPLCRAVCRAAIRAHQENQRLYHAVMTGRF